MEQKFSGGDAPVGSKAVYAISVAAEMVSMEIQNLRVYERRGLVSPGRTAGGNRLYSRDDLVRLVRVKQLLAEGLNLVGVAHVMSLESEVARLTSENRRLRANARSGPGPASRPNRGQGDH